MADESHPALKGMNETMETVKETGKGAVGGAVKWGLIAGGLAGAATLLAPALLMAIPGIGWLAGGALAIGGAATGAATGLVTGAALGAAKLGAVVGGTLGAARGLAGAGEKIEEKKNRMIENWERKEMASERREMVQMQRERLMASSRGPSQTLGVSPNSLPNRGMDAGMVRA
jgi:hypothetical protein